MANSSWSVVASYGTKLEADMARTILEAAGMPVLLHGDQSGIFGAGFQGWAPGNTTLSVPVEELARAQELLATDDPLGVA